MPASVGWNTAEQIRDHELAASIINGHDSSGNMVFDGVELQKLRSFVMDTSREERGLVDETAGTNGSLVGYLVAKHGTEDPAFEKRELERLREWFGKGVPAGEEVVRCWAWGYFWD